MVDKERLVDLAERCEAATGPDRELDLRLAVAVNRDDIFDAHYEWRWGWGGDEIEAWEPDSDARKPSGYLDPEQFCPRFTASLDAAMTLVPEGWFWRVGHSTLYDGWAALNRVHPDHCNREDEAFAKAATPALALCAAALRSLSTPSMKDVDDDD